MSQKVYEIITDRVIKAIESGAPAPWRKPWKGGASGRPVNASTGRAYTGCNLFLLSMAGSGRYLTFNQAKAAGGNVRAGEHGWPVVFYGTAQKKNGNQDGEGKNEYRFLRYYTVFNVSQCEGLPSDWTHAEPVPVNQIDAVEAADRLVIGYSDRPPVEHREGAGACYAPASDRIYMPNASQFNGAPEYYSTLFHELAHSTGHQSRLDRDGIRNVNAFNQHQYSFEELVAEFTATYLMGMAGLDNGAAEQNSVAYLSGWLDRLKREPTWLVKAAAQAQKAADYMTGQVRGQEAEAA